MYCFPGSMESTNLRSWSCILCLIVILPHTEGAFRFTNEPPNEKEVQERSNATLQWVYSVDDRTTELRSIEWGVREASDAYTTLIVENTAGVRTVSPNIPQAFKGRVYIEEPASLVIVKVTQQDSLIYICTLWRLLGSGLMGLSSTVKLIVNVAPVITVSSVAAHYTEGTSVSIDCTATGAPEPDVKWIRNGQVKITGKKSAALAFNKINRADDGQYTCQANNSVGSVNSQVAILVYYPANVVSYSSSAAKSWIGGMVKLKCVSDGVPTPTVTWYKPDGNEVGTSKASENTVDVTMTGVQDFGDYRCVAHNGINPADSVTVTVKQIKEPGSPNITSSDEDIQATSLTVRWAKPVDDGGSHITAYRVVLLNGGTEIKNDNVTDPTKRSLSLGGLEKDTSYIVKVYARNFVFEGRAGDKTLRTKHEGVPTAAELIDVPREVKSDEITLKWSKPPDNGAAITKYTVYKRTVSEDGSTGDWIKVTDITDPSVTEYDVKLEEGKEYDLVVTATNEFGEGLKEEGKSKRVKVLAGASKSSENQTGSRCEEEKTILHVAYLTTIALLLLVIVVLLVILWRLRRRPDYTRTQRGKCSECRSTVAMNPMAIEANIQPPTQGKSDNIAYEIPTTGDYMPLHPSTRSWEIEREKVNIAKVIGKGAFSQVAKATAWNISGNQDDTTVAVKMLKADAPESDRKDLLSELELMKKLKPHPHVIKLIGCVTESDPLLVLIEYVPYGDLLGYLRKSRGLNDTYFKDPDVKPKTSLTAEQLMKFAWQIADGMSYLSSRKIIHRDLAARNVLVGEGEKCKVTDFGMSRNVHQDDIYTRKSRGRLPVKWTAYEALLYETYTTQSDVWSYGVVLYEILTVGGSPYPGINGRQIASKLQEGYRMPKPQHVDNKLYQVMLLCWQEDPANRPTFAKLKDKMKEMERNHRTYVNLKQYDNSLYANVGDLTAG